MPRCLCSATPLPGSGGHNHRPMAKRPKKDAPTIENRKARFTYTISDTLEVGIMLQGPEVKSVRDGKVSLAEGYVRVQETPPSLHLHAVNIDEYGPSAGKPNR